MNNSKDKYQSETFLNEFRLLFQKWKDGEYQIEEIDSEYKIFPAKRQEKVFVIPWAHRHPDEFILLLLELIFIIIHYIAVPVYFINEFGHYWLLGWFFITGIMTPLEIIAFLGYMQILIMKKSGHTIIAPHGVFYTSSRKKNGYFTWSAIKSFELTHNLGAGVWASIGKYILCKINPRISKKRNDMHIIRYDILDCEEVQTFELFHKLLIAYNETFKDNSKVFSLIPKSNKLLILSICLAIFLVFLVLFLILLL